MELGRGKSGRVYLGQDGKAHKTFDNEAKYHKEKKFLLKNSIRHACDLHDYCDETKTLVFEYIPHVLEDILDMSINKQSILTQLAEFLMDANEKGIVHGDFKAKNVMVYDDLKTIRVIDFDNARKSTNNADDIKKFRFLVIQVMFGVSYKESYKRYPRYIKELRKTIHDPVLLMLLFDDHSEVTHDPRQF
jgi:serine/threonine protein kinase